MEAYGGPLDGQDIEVPRWRTDFEAVAGTAYVIEDGSVKLDTEVYRVERAPWGQVLVADGWRLASLSSQISRLFTRESDQQDWVDETLAGLRERLGPDHPEVGVAFESWPAAGCRLSLVYLVRS